MENTEIIDSIRENLQELDRKKSADVKLLVNTVVRSLGRLKAEDKSIQLQLSKLASDLRMNELNEEKFFRLNNSSSAKMEYSEGFYSSLNILKQELLVLLTKLEK